ncbi:MAG: radical SAM protein [Kiritimatiellaeota bacterium]|nr:radical SAM protein [Kiritimatiellota bacterium]
MNINKVLLLRPAPLHEQFGDESFMPLGLAYIAAVLEKSGCEVKVLDLLTTKRSEAQLLETITSFKPEVMGFTAVTPVVNSAYRMLEKIKGLNIRTVIGGPHASAMPQEALEKGFDFVVRGEGEETIVDLMQNIGAPENVKGISYKIDGKIINNPPREYLRNLDTLPFPARHLFSDLKLYKGQEALGSRVPVGSIMTSRGCPYSCSFCYKAVFGNRFRARSAENVVQEWVHLVEKYGVKEIAIVDDSFTTDVARVHKICDYLIKAHIKVRWSCPNGIRVDLGDLAMLKKMRTAGCYRTALGLESGSQNILDTIGKKITLAEMEAMIEHCRAAGIKTMGFYMLGNIGETQATMQATIDFARRVGTDYAQFLIAVPYPGTALYDEVKKNGKLYITDWDQYGQYERSACFEHGALTPDLLKQMCKKAEKEYYLDPKYVVKQLLNPETYLFLPRRLKAALRVISKA